MTAQKYIASLLLAGVLLTGCRDALGPTQKSVPAPESEKTNIIARLDCAVDVGTGTTTCKLAEPTRTAGGPARALLGNPYVKLRSSNVSYDSLSLIFTADITVQNLLPEAMGTPDGTTLTGVKVFYDSGPSATSYYNVGDTGTVVARNPDGIATFTHPNQPYYQYNQILAPNDTSAPKNWQWTIPRTVKTFAFVLLLTADLPSEARVPEFAPDSTPSWLYSQDSIITDTTYATGQYARNVVKIWFSPTTLQPRRRALIDSIGGVVVGGTRLGGKDGYYFVHVPGDSTGLATFNAIARLLANPAVLDGSRFWLNVFSSQSVQPNDGVDFQNWRLSPDSADGHNWGPEAIAAPLAWGCSRGDTATRIADVDSDFNPVADLTANAHPTLADPHFGALNTADDTADHGTKTAAIIAAAGNNTAGITGLMWTAHLRMYEAAIDPSTGAIAPRVGAANQPDMTLGLPAQILRAAREGAAVINLSFGLDWDVLVRSGYRPRLNSPDTVIVHDVTRGINTIIQTLDAEGHRPLFVLAAGNNNLDAYWAGMPNAALTWADRVIVVGATRQGNQAPNQFRRAAFSNFGGIAPVHVYAPGENVYTLNRSGNPRPASGTSFAAPHVTGVAGLLLSFDPRLTTDSLRSFIVRGAHRGGRTANGVDAVNAYESLKLAAEKRGASLCGNPVYQDTLGNVFARRDSAWTFQESLFTLRDSLMDPLHGGKRIHFAGGGTFQWTLSSPTAAVWTNTAGLPDTITNATNRSKAGFSHQGDSTVTLTVTKSSPAATQENFNVFVNGSQIATVVGPLVQPAQARNRQCIRWPVTETQSMCSYNIYATSYRDSLTTTATVAYSPAGDTVVLAIARDSFAYNIGGIVTDASDEYLLNGPLYKSIQSLIYFIPVRGGTVRGPVTRTTRVERVGLSEDGAFIVTQERNLFFESVNQISGAPIVSKINACGVAFLRNDGALSIFVPTYSYTFPADRRPCWAGSTFAP